MLCLPAGSRAPTGPKEHVTTMIQTACGEKPQSSSTRASPAAPSPPPAAAAKGITKCREFAPLDRVPFFFVSRTPSSAKVRPGTRCLWHACGWDSIRPPSRARGGAHTSPEPVRTRKRVLSRVQGSVPLRNPAHNKRIRGDEGDAFAFAAKSAKGRAAPTLAPGNAPRLFRQEGRWRRRRRRKQGGGTQGKFEEEGGRSPLSTTRHAKQCGGEVSSYPISLKEQCCKTSFFHKRHTTGHALRCQLEPDLMGV